MAEGDNWIWFGDGNMCTYIEKFERVEEEGIEMVHMLIRPSSLMQNEYNLKEQIDDRDGLMMVAYPKTAVDQLVNMPGKNRVLINLNVLGEPTPLSRKTAALELQIKQQQEIIRSHEVRIAILSDKFKKLSGSLTAEIKEQRKMFDEARKVAGRVKSRDDDEESEE
jgi:hypothetical protein